MPDAPEIAEHKHGKLTIRDLRKREQKALPLGSVIRELDGK